MARPPPSKCIYVVDTSSWIAISEHPDQNRIRDRLATLFEDERIKFPPEVLAELTQISDFANWLQQYKTTACENFRTDISYLKLVGEITFTFPAMVGARSTRNKADPYVVATAVHGAQNPHRRVVVCDETITVRPGRKIPTACAAYNVPCMSILTMLDQEYPEDAW